MLFKRSIIVGTLFVTALSMGTGCSSKSDTSKTGSEQGGEQGGEQAGEQGADAKDCPGTEATITITETGETATLTEAGGVSLSEGAAYTVYVADSEIDSSKISMVATPEPVMGHHLVTVAITVFNPEGTPPAIAEGTKIPFTPDFGVLTFRVIDDTGDESYNSSADAKGDVTMTKVGETVCFSIDYSDDEKTLTGTVAAPVKSL